MSARFGDKTDRNDCRCGHHPQQLEQKFKELANSSITYNGNPLFLSTTDGSVGEISYYLTAAVSRNPNDQTSIVRMTLNSNIVVPSSASASKGEGGEERTHPTSTRYNYSAIAKRREATPPCGSSLVGGILPSVGVTLEASGPRTEGFVSMVVGGVEGLCIWVAC